MSIASRITSIEGHISDIYDSVELTGVDTTDIDKNLVNVPNTLKEGYIDIINNGTDTLYNNFPKVSGEETSLTLNNTYQAPMRNNLKGNTSQTGTPTPTSPIPVNVVSGDNAITISNQGGTDSNTYNIDLPVENLFDKETLHTGDITGAYTTTRICDYQAKYLETGTYTFSANLTSTYRFYITINDSGTRPMGSYPTYSYNSGWVNDTTKTFTITTPGYFTLTIARSDNGTITLNDIKDFNYQLEKGTKANSYTPYGTTPIELCKIGNYQDYIYKDSDKWYLHEEIGKVVLNGSESWGVHGSIASWFYVDNLISGNTLNDSNNSMLSNYFKQEKYSNVTTLTNGQFAYTPSGNKRLVIKDTDYTTVADFKNWLSTHNVTLYYILATPTSTEITDTTLINQLEELYIAKSKENQTNISQINNDLPFIISASALKKGDTIENNSASLLMSFGGLPNTNGEEETPDFEEDVSDVEEETPIEESIEEEIDEEPIEEETDEEPVEEETEIEEEGE